MFLQPATHYFVRKNRVFLTPETISRFLGTKITASKIEWFFNLEEEEETPKKTPTPFYIWQQVINWISSKRSPRTEEENRKIEEKIIEYLNKNTGSRWVPYPLQLKDAFPYEQDLGGVPDAIERNNSVVTAVLEIKTNYFKKEVLVSSIIKRIPSKYLLQLFFYLLLNGLEEGYLVVCSVRNWETNHIGGVPHLNSNLEKIPIKGDGFVSKKFASYIPEIKEMNLEYWVLEMYKNTHPGDNELILVKLRFDVKKYEQSINSIKEWFIKHRRVSPEMTPEELKRVMYPQMFWKKRKR